MTYSFNDNRGNPRRAVGDHQDPRLSDTKDADSPSTEGKWVCGSEKVPAWRVVPRQDY